MFFCQPPRSLCEMIGHSFDYHTLREQRIAFCTRCGYQVEITHIISDTTTSKAEPT